ncbi:two-component system, chemotaxis family, CheB/CheR fusion protein [Massilia sp. PDC64]|nr:response regulator [Massilia sp. PDC64]SDD04771.1 two-component system, chemotaxis family, CheB/CheR fusion protein [Massilia sp. PDC64]
MSFAALLVDDSPDDRALVARELRRHFPQAQVKEAGSPETLAAALDDGRFDIAITDYRLRFTDGISVLRELKRRFPERPVIMFTASGNEEIAVEAMKEGLDDYITKTPKHYPRIGYAVRACLDHVAQRARAEQAQARLEIALQSAGVATWQFDLRERTIVASSDLGPMLGQPPGHAPATVDAWLADIHDDDRPRVIEAWKAAFAGTGDYRMQYRFHGADGVTRWIASSARVLRGADGKPSMVIGTAREVTADIETRRDLERKTEELEQADRQKNEFLAILAHELRNPLGAARYSIALLRQASDNAAIRARATDVIDRQIGHMATMLDALLDLSRIAHNRIELERAPLDVRRIVELACENAQSAFEGKGHALRLSLPPEPVTVVGDEVRLTQVVANLLVNAAKFTPAPGHIDVRVTRDGTDAVIEVADDGIGIAPHRLDEVFEMFSQGETKAHGGTPGLGIGLAVVRSLVGLHGGTVRAHSAGAGQGTRIRVTLPAPAQSAQAAPSDASVAAGATRGLRMLLADDNADAANLLALLLEAEGHTVHAAFDGISAMALADAHRPDVMVLDIGMPGATGYEVARWVREQPWGAAVRLVAVTGWGHEHDGGRALDAGFDVRLVKPVDMTQLLAAVNAPPPG